MKQFISRILLLLSILPNSLKAQQQNGYEINGHMDGLSEGEKVVMSLMGPGNWEFHNSDSADVKNGSFHIAGFVPEGPRPYALLFDKHPNKCVRLLVENNEKIKINSGDINEIPHNFIEHFVTIEGSPSTTAWNYLWSFDAFYLQEIIGINKYLDKIKDSVGFDRPLVDGLLTSKRVMTHMLYAMVFKNPDLPYKSAIPFYIIANKTFITSGHDNFIENVYNDLDEKGKNSFYGKKLKEMTSLCIGKTFPEFTLPTPEGKLISLKEVTDKSKITIVHFWASNSYERVIYQQELLTLYKKYHDKGLNVIGISADSVAAEWKARMFAEQYPWLNVSDLKGNLQGGIVQDVYHEGGHHVPNTTNVLLDAQGKIIAWDVSGVELQWYLWKYLDHEFDTKAQLSGK